MLAELLQPMHILVLFFGGRWFTTLGNGFRDSIRNYRNATKVTPPK
jgi:hypothetical protein